MIVLAKEDVLNALKNFKRLAKQDLLASSLTTEPELWSAQAEGRRNTYTWLMELVEEHGVDYAYQAAKEKYADLPFLVPENKDDPDIIGTKQALEMLFGILGVGPDSEMDDNEDKAMGAQTV